jgi:hypothetical protein
MNAYAARFLTRVAVRPSPQLPGTGMQQAVSCQLANIKALALFNFPPPPRSPRTISRSTSAHSSTSTESQIICKPCRPMPSESPGTPLPVRLCGIPDFAAFMCHLSIALYVAPLSPLQIAMGYMVFLYSTTETEVGAGVNDTA